MEDATAAARRQMVERQLRERGIRDERVLAAMQKVPRHLFVPGAEAARAYDDHALPIGAGQTISQPYMVAVMSECLALQGHERVLEVGTGSGYQAAVLAELCAEVYSIERIESLAEHTRERLARVGYAGVHVVVGDGTLGLPDHAPYQGIIVTAGAPRIAPAWVEQLEEGCRLAAPVGDRWTQQLICATKSGGKLQQRNVCGCVFVPLVGKEGWPGD